MTTIGIFGRLRGTIRRIKSTVRSARIALAVTVATTAAALAVTAAAPRAQARGQDFPFFCALNDGTGRQLVVQGEPRSPTGYTVGLVVDGGYENLMFADVSLSDDGLHYVVYGREHISALHDRQVLAFIGKNGNADHSADVRESFRNVDTTFEPHPIDCGAH